MSFSTSLSLVGLLHWVAAILACVWAVRANKSREHILLLPVGAAVFAGLFMIVPLVQMAGAFGEELDQVPYQLVSVLMSSAILGAFVGVAGVVWQTIAKRRAHRA